MSYQNKDYNTAWKAALLAASRCVPCTYCGAEPGQDCRSEAGEVAQAPHKPRRRATSSWVSRSTCAVVICPVCAEAVRPDFRGTHTCPPKPPIQQAGDDAASRWVDLDGAP